MPRIYRAKTEWAPGAKPSGFLYPSEMLCGDPEGDHELRARLHRLGVGESMREECGAGTVIVFTYIGME